VSKRVELKQQLSKLQTELQETKKMTGKYEADSKKVEDNLELIEAIGRDKYYMKRDNEDLYIFLEEDEKTGKLASFEE
jgi:cell division protein FtsB